MELILGEQNVTYSKAPFESYQIAFQVPTQVLLDLILKWVSSS